MISSEALARFGTTPTPQQSDTSGPTFDMAGYLQAAGFDVIRCKPWPAYPGGLIFELVRCPFNVDHVHGSAAFTLLDGKPGFSCQHNGCSSKTIKDVFALFPPGGAAGRRVNFVDGAKENSPPSAGTEGEVAEDRLPDFPESAWRGAFADYREAMEGTTEASDVAHFATLWAGIAVTLGRRVWMYAGERIYPNTYLAIFGSTGDKKTTAQRRILNLGLLAPSINVIPNLGSTEGLADKLKRQDRADAIGLFFWEELTSLLARGRWSGSTILEFVTETFDCPDEWNTYYRKDPIKLVRPTPTILAGTTSEWFWKNARPDDFYGGFGNRFLYMTGPKKAPIANPLEPGGAALQRVRNALAGLFDLNPVQARFSPDAGQLWARFYMSWEQRDRTGLYAASVKRVHIYIRKLALTYAALEGTLPEITFDQLKAAIAVGVYADECAKVLIEAKNASQPVGELEQRVLKWIEAHDGAKKAVHAANSV